MESGTPELQKFCLHIPDPNLRAEAIRLAWLGFDKKDPGTAVFMLALIGVSILVMFHSRTFGLTGIVVGVLVLAIDWWNADRINRERKRLQQAATPFLSGRFLDWKTLAESRIPGKLRSSSSIPDSERELVITWPLPLESHMPHYVRPAFSESPYYGVAGYFLGSRSLVVAPSSTIELQTRDRSIGRWLSDKVRDSVSSWTRDFPYIDFIETAVSESTTGEADPVYRHFSRVEVAELFYDNMISIEYRSEEGQVGELSVTTSDGRLFRLRSVPALADHLRESIRSLKRSADDDSKEQTYTETEQVAATGLADTKTCPMCAEDVKKAARICRYCGHDFQRK